MSGEVKAKEFIDIDDYADVTTELTKDDIVSSISRGPANAEGYAGRKFHLLDPQVPTNHF